MEYENPDVFVLYDCYYTLLDTLRRTPHRYTGCYTAKSGKTTCRQLQSRDIDIFERCMVGDNLADVASEFNLSVTATSNSRRVAEDVIKREFRKECLDC